MKGIFFFTVLTVFELKLAAQKIYTVLNLTSPFHGISHAPDHVKGEFYPSVPQFNLDLGAEIHYKGKHVHHKFTIEQAPLGKSFKLNNKFLDPPNDTLLGIRSIAFGTAIDHFILAYSLQWDRKKNNGFMFHSTINLNWSLGLGVSFNRSNSLYQNRYTNSNGGRIDNWTYMAFDIVHTKLGPGVFLKGTTGFDLINRKKKKRILSMQAFFNKGFTNMVRFNIHYIYGYHAYPDKRVEVANQVLYTKGTNFGFSVGLPIKIKN